MANMKNLRQFISFGVTAGLLLAGCSGNKNSDSANATQMIAVKGVLVVPTSKQLIRTFTGSIEGEKQAVLRAKIAEAVEKVNFRVGDFVKTNDVLISLDRTGPTSNYTQAYSVYQNAEKNFSKIKYLFVEGAVSESQFDAAQTEFEVARANYEAALQMVELRSPIDGRVTSIDVYAGQYVSPGQQLATVASTGQVRMKLGVSGNDIAYFKEGQKVTISAEADSVISGEGTVLTVARSADPDTRTFQVDVAVNNQDRRFKPGMFARANIIIGDFANAIVAPRQAILTREGRNYAFVASDGAARMREVTLGVDFNGVTQVISGLQSGDTLIVVGQNYLQDGSRINLARFVDESGKERAL